MERNDHQDGSPDLKKKGSPIKLHATRDALLLIIGAVVRVFVKSQRRDTYYRNDPSKYGLDIYYKKIASIIVTWSVTCGSIFSKASRNKTRGAILLDLSFFSPVKFA